jgi:hypothetical protein
VTLDNGRRFRVPNGADELAVAELPHDQALHALTSRCAIDTAPGEGDEADFEAALETSAPVLDLELSATCPECRTDNALTFRMQSYLLRALVEERGGLSGELDVLARAYGWSLSELLDLPRSMRAQLVRLLEARRTRRVGW